MNRRIAAVVVVVCLLSAGICRIFAADAQEKPAVTGYPEARLTGDVLLVNVKTVEVPFILKDYRLVSIGGKVFLQGTCADIGEDEKGAGLRASLAVDDISVIREFTWKQAKEYYGLGFREKVPADE